MIVEIDVIAPPGAEPPSAAVCRVEIRDVTLIDAPAVTVDACEIPGAELRQDRSSTVVLKIPDACVASRSHSVWAHLSYTGAKEIKPEDYITTRAYPIGRTGSKNRVEVELKPVSRSGL